MDDDIAPHNDPGLDEINGVEMAAGLAATPGYRYADHVENQLFVAGQVPLDRHGDLVGADDPAAQANACLHNLRTLLDVHGFAPADIRQLTVYVVGEHQNLLDAWAAVTDWFPGHVPPATLLGVNLLGHQHQLVEIDATVIGAIGSATELGADRPSEANDQPTEDGSGGQ